MFDFFTRRTVTECGICKRDAEEHESGYWHHGHCGNIIGKDCIEEIIENQILNGTLQPEGTFVIHIQPSCFLFYSKSLKIASYRYIQLPLLQTEVRRK